jgi:MoaA/NifB/PqqE/SkfB family radical SAM enzyme
MKTSELTTEEWLSIISQLADLGCRRVTLLGGEPLVRTDIAAMIRHAREKGMSCLLSTNGILVPERINELKDLSAIVLSLDSAGPSNDKVRGKGVFDAAKEAIIAAKDAGIPIKINSVLSMATALELDSFLEFLDEYDLTATFNPMRSGNPVLWKDAASIQDSDKKVRKLFLKLADLARQNQRILFTDKIFQYGALWKDFSIDCYEEGELSKDDPILVKGPHCQAGRYYMSINPDGSVSPCVISKDKIRKGNVVREGVETSWKSIHDHNCIACSSPCLVELNYLFSLHPRVIINFLRRQFRQFA